MISIRVLDPSGERMSVGCFLTQVLAQNAAHSEEIRGGRFVNTSSSGPLVASLVQ